MGEKCPTPLVETRKRIGKAATKASWRSLSPLQEGYPNDSGAEDGPEKSMAYHRELGGKIIACEMSMEVMGIKEGGLRPGPSDEIRAVGAYVSEARDPRITLAD